MFFPTRFDETCTVTEPVGRAGKQSKYTYIHTYIHTYLLYGTIHTYLLYGTIHTYLLTIPYTVSYLHTSFFE